MTKSEALLDLWNRILAHLESTLGGDFDRYLKGTHPDESRPELTVLVRDDWIKNVLSGRLGPRIQETADLVAGRPVSIQYRIDTTLPVRLVEEPLVSPGTAAGGMEASNLNPKYLLENYVVGQTNRLAYSASQAVVRGLGDTYNPFFLWGPVGVGKTHLMQGIGHQVLKDRPELKVMYVTAEIFTNEWFEAIKEKITKDFQKKYRGVDLLLIDDVQFFEKMESMQEAFFHTFNELYQKQKQIVLTSDRPPKQLDRLQERLVNRFESGLTSEVSAPDLETRLEILKKLVSRHRIEIPTEPLRELAERVTSNIRELEGAFTRVTAYSSLLSLPLTKELVGEILKEFSPRTKDLAPSRELIVKTVAEYFGLSVPEIMTRQQTRRVSVPRQVAMYLIHDLLGVTLKETALHFGKKDHTTVLYACEKIRASLGDDEGLGRDVRLIKIKIRGLTKP